MSISKLVTGAAVAIAALMASTCMADELIYSGFMSDYTQLEKVTDGSADYRYVAPGDEDRLAQFKAVMIDQPEIFIANDSPYRGAKPKHLVALAESLRAALTSSLSEDLYVVDNPGENVLYISMAMTNLKLTKKKRGIMGYTPLGFVAGSVKRAATSDIAKKADLQGVVFEFEGFDSGTGERIVAIIDSFGDDVEAPGSWEQLDEYMAKYARLARCRFNNAELPVEQRVNCLAQD
jgi:hypothetical protein